MISADPTPPLSQAEREANVLSVVRVALQDLRGADYRTRTRGIMFVATILGHKMGPSQLREQPWGTVGECAHCGQIGKTRRDGDAIEGRAISTICPAGRPR